MRRSVERVAVWQPATALGQGQAGATAQGHGCRQNTGCLLQGAGAKPSGRTEGHRVSGWAAGKAWVAEKTGEDCVRLGGGQGGPGRASAAWGRACGAQQEQAARRQGPEGLRERPAQG